MNTRRRTQVLVAALLLVTGNGLANSISAMLYPGSGGGGGPLAGHGDAIATVASPCPADLEAADCTIVAQVGGGAAAGGEARGDDPATHSFVQKAEKHLTEFDTPPYLR